MARFLVHGICCTPTQGPSVMSLDRERAHQADPCYRSPVSRKQGRGREPFAWIMSKLNTGAATSTAVPRHANCSVPFGPTRCNKHNGSGYCAGTGVAGRALTSAAPATNASVERCHFCQFSEHAQWLSSAKYQTPRPQAPGWQALESCFTRSRDARLRNAGILAWASVKASSRCLRSLNCRPRGGTGLESQTHERQEPSSRASIP